MKYLTLILCALINTIAFCAEPSTVKNTELNKMLLEVKPVSIEPQSADDALAVADQLRSISKAIKLKQEIILVSPYSINISIINKLKSIIQIIEIQRKNLIDLIMSDGTKSDNERLNSIIHSLSSQRNSLSDLIPPELNSVSNQQTNQLNMNTVNQPDKKFIIYSRT